MKIKLPTHARRSQIYRAACDAAVSNYPGGFQMNHKDLNELIDVLTVAEMHIDNARLKNKDESVAAHINDALALVHKAQGIANSEVWRRWEAEQ